MQSNSVISPWQRTLANAIRIDPGPEAMREFSGPIRKAWLTIPIHCPGKFRARTS